MREKAHSLHTLMRIKKKEKWREVIIVQRRIEQKTGGKYFFH